MRKLVGFSLISVVSAFTACGGGKSTTVADAGVTHDGAVSSLDAGGDAAVTSPDAAVVACAPTSSCTAVDKTCIGLVDNSSATKFGLRMSQVTLTTPMALTMGLIGSTIASAATPDIASCNLDGQGTLSWLLQFDTTAGTLTTGGAKPVSDPTTGYSFDTETLSGFTVAAATMTTTPDATGKFSVSTGVALNMPIFLDAAGSNAVLLPLQQARISMGTLSSSHDCIGSYNAAALDPTNNCQPTSTTRAFVDGGSFDGFIKLTDADQVTIAPLNESLCALLSGDGNGASPSKCKTDTSGAIAYQGDWCSTTNTAATSTCADAVHLAGTFAASSVKIQ